MCLKLKFKIDAKDDSKLTTKTDMKNVRKHIEFSFQKHPKTTAKIHQNRYKINVK